MKGQLIARDTADAVKEKSRRIDVIVEMMAVGQWHGAASSRALQKEWACSADALADYANIAGGILRKMGTPESKDAARAMMLASVERIRGFAQQAGEKGDSRALQVALNALEAYGKLYDLYPAQRIEVVGREAWLALTTGEKRARLAAARERLDALEAELNIVEHSK